MEKSNFDIPVEVVRKLLKKMIFSTDYFYVHTFTSTNIAVKSVDKKWWLLLTNSGKYSFMDPVSTPFIKNELSDLVKEVYNFYVYETPRHNPSLKKVTHEIDSLQGMVDEIPENK